MSPQLKNEKGAQIKQMTKSRANQVKRIPK